MYKTDAYLYKFVMKYMKFRVKIGCTVSELTWGRGSAIMTL